MSTKLEAVVGLLAGREVEPKLLDELADPSSDASRFLEATRTRSKALFDGPVEVPRRDRDGRGRWVIALVLLVVSALVALAAALRAVDHRFRQVENHLEAKDAEAKAEARRIETLLGRLADSTSDADRAATIGAALGRIEDRLARLEAAPAPDKAEPRTLEEFAAIRRELAAIDKQSADRAEDLQAAVHDTGRVLRLLLNRFDPAPAGADKPPSFPPARPPAGVDPRRSKP